MIWLKAAGRMLGLALLAGLAFGACGDDTGDGTQTSTPTAAPALEATATPQPTPAGQTQRPWAFLGTRLIRAAFPPADLELYRSLLPSQFDMPDQPLVVVTVAHYYDVTPPLVPYREGYVLLQCKYQGRTGWYTYTMPVDDEIANAGGRAIGFNKYVADEITLEQEGSAWKGRVVHQGRTVMEIVFTPESKPVTATSAGEEVTLFNLLPPGEGPEVIEVNTNPAEGETKTATAGSATVRADAGEAWAGLLGPEGKAVWAAYEETTGDSVLDVSNQ